MEKVNAVLVIPDEGFLTEAIQNIEFDKINLLAVMTEKVGGNTLKVNGQNILQVDFSAIVEILNREPVCLWLVCSSTDKIKKRLIDVGVAERDIVLYEMPAQIDCGWLASLRWLEKNNADFFATGGSTAMVGLDFIYLPGKGVNLSGMNQSLRQGYQTAKYIFEHVDTIKFVLIDLSPMLFPCAEDSAKFDVLSNKKTSADEVDLNCERAKEIFRQKFSKKTLIDLASSNPPTDSNLKEDLQILQAYAKLCFDNGARPVFVTFPVAMTLKKNYDADVLTHFRQEISAVEKNYKSLFIDLLGVKLPGSCFYGKSHLSSSGALATTAIVAAKLYFAEIISAKQICEMDANYFNVLSKYASDDYKALIHQLFCNIAFNDFKHLSKTLPQNECSDLMARVFSNMTYDHLAILSKMLPKEAYNDLLERIFKISAEKIRHKSKIKVGFFFEHSSKWPGDELYNLFARNSRFEPTVFIYLKGNELTHKEFLQDLDRFKSHGLNVFVVEKADSDVPTQDVLIQTSPYNNVPKSFRLTNLKLTTLLAYIPYSFGVTYRKGFLDWPFFRVLWRAFFTATIPLKVQDEICSVGMPRGVYSGYPKMDVFFNKNTTFKFDWKMTRPNAKKIIWAPHHSIAGETLPYSTFQWNYKFMYEFAKAHPEISWVLKPHPHLLGTAVVMKLFPSVEAFKEYLQKWDDLPNAQVYLGTYYQAMFATSDGMIQDSASFLAEYQYVNKPMIYLMREGNTRMMNDLAKEILKVSYLVDGKDLDGIAAAIQKVFIEGNDYKAAERKEVFDKYLNYPKDNGMLASEFIFKTVADELKMPTK